MSFADARPLVREALAALGVDDLVFGIHDLSFPAAAAEDTGRGTPYSEAGFRFLGFVRELGFDGLQLGPQGRRPPGRTSPYDGAIFARDDLCISLGRLASDAALPLLGRSRLEALVAAKPPGPGTRVAHEYVERAHRAALGEAFDAFLAREDAGDPGAAAWALRLRDFSERHAFWLEPHGLFEVLSRLHGGAPSEEWGEPDARLFAPRPGEAPHADARRKALTALHARALRFEAFVQLLAHAQHAAFQEELRGLGIRLFADFQIGMSPRDVWAWRTVLLPGYAMGAPPSRTNPDGQPWHYPVLHPQQLGTPASPGPALELLLRRVDKIFDEYDAIRLDHPHGLVCPWVYRSDLPDPLRAVQQGARLLSSPDLPDHPELAPFSIPRREQLNPDPATPRHADDWVVALEPEQVARYAVAVDAIVVAARRHGRPAEALVCEVLSTQPHPLRRVLERHGLGRFRITQKADVADPRDVYRSENARAQDWIMVGNHDTEPLWARLGTWADRGELPARARYLAGRLVPEPAQRERFAVALLADPGRFADAQFADLFASPARHVMVFFADLFGEAEPYNRPGTVTADNWSLRVPGDYRAAYAAALAERRALNLPASLALALRARGGEGPEALAGRLDGMATRFREAG
jgi:4-alpha-glucanotransferase